MNPHKLLQEAADIIGERGKDYGGVEDNFQRIVEIYEHSTGESASTYHVAMMMACVKMARINQSPCKRDNYLDAINYLAFAAELIGAE